MLSLLRFACAVAMVDASKLLNVPRCGLGILADSDKNGYKTYANTAVRLSGGGGTNHVGSLISPQHVLVKMPDGGEFDFGAVTVVAGIDNLASGGGIDVDTTTTVSTSSTCGPFTVLTLDKPVNGPQWACVSRSKKGEAFGFAFLAGFNPTTSYSELSRTKILKKKEDKPKGTTNSKCAKTTDLEFGYVWGGSFISPIRADAWSLPRFEKTDPIMLENANFLIREGGRPTRQMILGHFDRWDGKDDKGNYKFAFARFTDDEVDCMEKIIDPTK